MSTVLTSPTIITLQLTVQDEKSRVIQWLSPLEPQKRHQDVRIRRLDGIGDWLLETAEFQKWCKAEDVSVSSILFCSRDSGAGKTHISSLVVDTLCHQLAGKDVGVACLYCDFHAHEEQVTTSMMGGILKQLVAAVDEIPEISKAFQKSKESIGRRGLRLPDILKLLAKILASFRWTFICIDGLDEYAIERRPELLRSLQQVLRDSPTTRLFLAGRRHLKEEVKKHLSESIAHIATKPYESDIKKYISMKISEDPDPHAMDSELESEIMKSISENSSDIFLLVALQIEAVLGETSIHRRRQKLHQKANGLHEVYTATLDRINHQRGDKPRLGMEVLLWVSLAQRPLSVSELCDALGVEIGSTDLNAKNIPPIQTLLGSCLGLVTVDKETSRVRLIHSTLQEYLQAHTTLFDNGHAKIAEVCLTYLKFSVVRALPRSVETAPVNMPFLIYASYH
ncbi:hypothetical protein L873DRAFT_344234 [Choiromyces venosus 120613-1]|uniref:NACHT domain-containing protein n=1 Tax=Choiromyces venosus 120613-1 TaxID=1336337 RepID=A0A3N4IYV8_9PEZI|nr:hypothetical protein L873DRAFT_344234 [Choiromyces venosus 120613-1]